MIHRATLADEGRSVCTSGKEFVYDRMMCHRVVPFRKDIDWHLTIEVDTQRRSMKEIFLLFVKRYAVSGRDSKKYIFPDITNVSVTIKGFPKCCTTRESKSRISGPKPAASS